MPQLIYVPDFNPTTMPCVTVSATTIRVYDSMPTPNSDRTYTDYFYNASYSWTKNTQSFGNNALTIYCIPNHLITSDFMYRNDIDGIMMTFAIYSVFVFMIPLLIFKKLFKKR